MTTRDRMFGFRGRVRRQDWWIGNLLIGIAQVVATFALASVVSMINLSQSAAPQSPFEALAAVPPYLTWTLQLAFLWPTVALSVQRYHDRDRSAWPVIAYYVAFYCADLIPPSATAWTSGLDASMQQGLFYGWAAIWIGLSLWLFITLGFLDGTPRPNRFGPSPKASELAAG